MVSPTGLTGGRYSAHVHPVPLNHGVVGPTSQSPPRTSRIGEAICSMPGREQALAGAATALDVLYCIALRRTGNLSGHLFPWYERPELADPLGSLDGVRASDTDTSTGPIQAIRDRVRCDGTTDAAAPPVELGWQNRFWATEVDALWLWAGAATRLAAREAIGAA